MCTSSGEAHPIRPSTRRTTARRLHVTPSSHTPCPCGVGGVRLQHPGAERSSGGVAGGHSDAAPPLCTGSDSAPVCLTASRNAARADITWCCASPWVLLHVPGTRLADHSHAGPHHPDHPHVIFIPVWHHTWWSADGSHDERHSPILCCGFAGSRL